MDFDEKLLCFLCFEKLINVITAKKQDLVLHKIPLSERQNKAPVFVSWYVNGELRGNVGCFEDIQIISGISEYAITSAMKDWRYSPISRGELHNLKCTVSILKDYKFASDLNDWEKGKHGIRLFIDGYTSTLFPNEMDENQSKGEIFHKLVKLAGFSDEKIDDQKIQKARIKTFQISEVSADFNEYLAFVEKNYKKE